MARLFKVRISIYSLSLLTLYLFSSENTWEKIKNLEGSKHLIAAFDKKQDEIDLKNSEKVGSGFALNPLNCNSGLHCRTNRSRKVSSEGALVPDQMARIQI